MTLEELYSRKITKTVENIIIPKEDFSKIAPNWCDKVCKLKCKTPSKLNLNFPIDNKPTDILIIQDSKSFDDVRFNKSGSKIEQTMLGVIRYIAGSVFPSEEITYRITSLLKCGISRADISKGKGPSETVLLKCRPYILEEIDRLKPKVIISLNTSVSKALGIGKTNSTNRGELAYYNDIPVVVTLHPRILTMLRQNSTGAFWGPDFYSVIVKDFTKALRLIRGELRVPDLDAAIERAKKQITVARSLPEVITLVTKLKELGQAGKILSYDTETTGLDPMASTAKLITVQFGYKESDGVYKAFVFPMWHRNNIWFNPDEAWVFIREILEDKTIGKIGHNMKFDYLYTWFTTGVKVEKIVFDTMLLLHMINSGIQGMYGLKKAVVDWLPETELTGYEDKLPKLTKLKVEGVVDDEELEEDEGEEDGEKD